MKNQTKIILAMLASVTLLLPDTAFGVYVARYDGGVGNWSNPLNWSPGGYSQSYPNNTVPDRTVTGDNTVVRVDWFFNGTDVTVNSSVPDVRDLYLGRVNNDTATLRIAPGGSLIASSLAVPHTGNSVPTAHATGIVIQTGGYFFNGALSLGGGTAAQGNRGLYTMTGGELHVNGNLSIGGGGGNTAALNSLMDISGPSTVTIDGTVLLRGAAGTAGDTGTLDISAGDVTIGRIDNIGLGGEGKFIWSATTGDLAVGEFEYDDPDGAVFTVASGTTLTINGDGSNIITDGLDVSGTLNMFSTVAGSATIDGDVEFLTGSTFDYGVNPAAGVEDTISLDPGSTLTMNSAFTLDLSVFGSDYATLTDEFTLFEFDTATGPSNEALLNSLVSYGYPPRTQTLAANNPFLEIRVIDGTRSAIILSGFGAFAIPEPSSLLLFGLGGLLMHRRIRRKLRTA